LWVSPASLTLVLYQSPPSKPGPWCSCVSVQLVQKAYTDRTGGAKSAGR
jgi:hypothetical protein